jgi:DNA (cytosine-5)-methyltransferase 1
VRLLDLFCGAGGAAVGYHRAGFTEIVGVDIKPQPRYPFTFVLGDALEYVKAHGHQYDAIHASPPCQGYSIMRNLPWLRGKKYPLLIASTAAALNETTRPWVIENVMGAKLASGWLCGTMFGLPFFRHRYFWAGGWMWLQPSHEIHRQRIRPGHSLAGRARDIVFSKNEDARGIQSWPGRRGDAGHGLTIAGNGAQANGCAIGHAKGARAAAMAMGVDWMRREEITQAIPPAYTEFIGRQLLAVLTPR